MTRSAWTVGGGAVTLPRDYEAVRNDCLSHSYYHFVGNRPNSAYGQRLDRSIGMPSVVPISPKIGGDLHA